MALPFRTARAIVGVVKESAAGTFVEPAATDSCHAVNIAFNPTQQLYERKDTRAHFGLLDALPGSAEADISFEIPLVGMAAGLTVLPFWDVFMIACGHKRIFVSGASATYTPTTTFDGSGTTTLLPSEGYSVAIWMEGTGPRFAITGAQGDVSISTKQGEPLIAKFKFHGAYQVVADDATAPAVVDSVLIPPVFLGGAMTVHSVTTLAFDGFEFSKGNVMSKRGDISAVSGVRGAWITAHKPMIKISPELVTVASLDYYGKWRGTAATPYGNFIAALTSPAAGQRFTLTAPRTQFRDLGVGDREGAVVNDINMACVTVATDVAGTDYSLAIT